MLWAVHISDGILSKPWWLGGFVLLAVLALVGARRIQEEEIPRIGLLTAALFIASLIHVRVGPTSVHLLLNGLAGVLLGWRTALAIPVALSLQALLLAHGGYTTIGINSCIMTLPALLAGAVFSGLRRTSWLQRFWVRPEFFLGFLAGELAVLGAIALNGFVLMVGGEADLTWPALIMVVAHVPIAAIEGIVLGFTVSFLARVKPEMLGYAGSLRAEESSIPKQDVEITSLMQNPNHLNAVGDGSIKDQVILKAGDGPDA